MNMKKKKKKINEYESHMFSYVPEIKMKDCEYKNCINTFEERGSKRFCSDTCRKHHFTYEKREKERIERERERVTILIKEYGVKEKLRISADALKLFEIIYK